MKQEIGNRDFSVLVHFSTPNIAEYETPLVHFSTPNINEGERPLITHRYDCTGKYIHLYYIITSQISRKLYLIQSEHCLNYRYHMAFCMCAHS